MFITDASTHQSVMSALAGNGKSVWSAIQLSSLLPWFIVTYVQVTEDGRHEENILLSSSEMVLTFFQGHAPNISPKAALLVWHDSKSNCAPWRISLVKELWKAREKDADAYQHVCICADGSKHSDLLPLVDETFIDWQLLMKFPG
ncbi:hypothetical protein [Uliginosibacterium gangwonense]|uniref:hypothetical protein n=1 Tax=Uliginosibacterium gangwonense TaxID=392736 RepID=UPI00037634AC|nr:hypothetical protein [Uliginosibacterium gangwonense]